MAVIKMKPTSPGRRGVVKVTREQLHKGEGYAPLLEPQFQRAGRNSGGIGGHGLVRDALDGVGINPRCADIILQGPPWRWNFADRAKRHAGKVAQFEARIGRAPNQKEGITHHHRAKQPQGAGGIGIMR